MISSITIERKAPDARRHAAVIRQALLAADRRTITAAEAAGLTGLPIGYCQEALLHLYGEHPAEITVGDAGEMRFAFTSLRQHRPTVRRPPFAGLTSAIAGWYRRHQDVILALITLPLVPPFTWTVFGNMQGYMEAVFAGKAQLPGWLVAAMIPLHLVTLVATLVSGIAFVFSALIFIAFPLGGLLLLVAGPIIMAYPLAHHGKAIQLLLTVPLGGVMLAIGGAMCLYWWNAFREAVWEGTNAWAKETWTVAGKLLIGPVSRRDTLSDERRLTALIGRQRGVLCRSDVMTLFGWTQAQADRELTRILLDYGGEIAVTPKGAILYRFAVATDREIEADLRPIYVRGPEIGPFWDLEPTLVWALGLTMLAAVVGLWLHPHLIVLPDLADFVDLWDKRGTKDTRGMLEGFGAWPYVLIVVPNLLRGVVRAGKLWLWRRQRVWWPLLQLAIEHPYGELRPSVDTARLTALGGTIDPERTSEAGEVWVHFPTLALEQAEVDRARDRLRQGATNLAQAIGAESV